MKTIAWLALALVLGCGDDDGGGSPDAFVADMPTVTGSPVGGACGADTDCRDGLLCDSGETDDGGRDWPGGYCTRGCVIDGDCPFGARCASLYFDTEGNEVFGCAAACERELDSRGGCRDGYECDFDGICVLGCTEDSHCQSPDRSPNGTCEVDTGRCRFGNSPGALDGASCTTNDECAPNQACILGRCMGLDCDLGGDRACTNGWTCSSWTLLFDVLFFVCAEPCELGSDSCPASFACVPEEADVGELASGSHCAFGNLGGGASPDASTGDPCTTNADCPARGGLELCEEGFCSSYYCAAESLPTELAGCDAGAVCSQSLIGVEAAGRAVALTAELGVCRRDCSGNPSVCAAGASCNLGTVCLSDDS